MKYGTCFIIALVVDEKFLDVELHSLMLTFANVAWRVIGLQSYTRKVAHAGLFWQNTSPSHFLRNPTFGVISTIERLFSKAQTTGGGNKFLEFVV